MRTKGNAKMTGRRISTAAIFLYGLSITCGGALFFVPSDSSIFKILLILLLASCVVGLCLQQYIVAARLRQYDIAVNMLRSLNPDSQLQNSKWQPLNILIDDLQFSLQRDYSWQLSQKQTMLNALQSQINPHFLYNTLDCIRGQALDNDMDEIANMVEALSTIFRYSISTTDSLVQLRDEVQNIQTYFTIQQYRFKDRFQLRIHCDDNRALNCYMPKLTLQPLVENCIFHGLELKQGGGMIDIHIVLTDKRLIITVADDGCGIDHVDLAELQHKLADLSDVPPDAAKARHGIAMQNLSRRIRLLFGSDYGVFISSQVNCGTEVEIIIPAMFSKPEDAAVLV